MTTIMDGKKLRDKILSGLKSEIQTFDKKPVLAVILAGDDAASRIYVNNKKKTAENLGIKSIVIEYPADVEENVLLKKIEELNLDKEINAILVQLPLPAHIDKQKVIDTIAPIKDVDCFTIENSGRLYTGLEPYVYPCTPQGILYLLDEYGINLDGKHVVVIGRSNLVGKPMAQLTLKRNATVTICHSHTKNLSDITKTADVLISAVGEVLIEDDMMKDDCVVIDVGIFRDCNGKVRGDVNFETVSKKASCITPVPGGVGPMTIASLMVNTVKLYKEQNKRSS